LTIRATKPDQNPPDAAAALIRTALPGWAVAPARGPRDVGPRKVISKGAVGDGAGLSDDLVESLFGHHSGTWSSSRPVRRTWRLSVGEYAGPHRRALYGGPHDQVQVGGAQAA
jgi:hypothetical protein